MGGHHVVGQALAQLLPQLVLRRKRGLSLRGGVAAAAQDQVGHEAAVAGRVLARRDHGVAHGGAAQQRALDLAQLDAVTPHLDLVVHTPQVVDATVGQIATQITRAVHAGSRRSEGVGQETRGGELGALEVATRQAQAADVELAGDADGDRLQLLVEEEDLRVGHRPADGHPLARANLAPRGVGGVLGGTVEVVDPDPWQPLLERAHQLSAQRLARQVDDPQALGQRGCLEQRLGRRGHRVEQRRLQRRAGLQQRQRARYQQHRAALGQRDEELEDRQVEAHRGRQHHAAQRLGVEAARGPLDEGHRAVVLQRHCLGASRRARGVDAVGEAAGVAAARGPSRRALLDVVPLRVQAHHAHARGLAQSRAQVLLRQHHGRPRVPAPSTSVGPRAPPGPAARTPRPP